ncbi:hypothetical protein [Bacillus horti]|uniref:Transferrin-binding protein B C-lobe/N-lobe beta barrel domain-containing protein n=1 Tax=Caldalkalibacillus horti TaxID=77523 RepID=A0ABT9W4U1_9BACI|nr:hypothetical protein [Bacillus horti]MDQ0168268.1 hypothetical protein [Bacillus horti]
MTEKESGKVKKSFWKNWWFWAIAIIVIAAIASSGSDDSEQQTTTTVPAPATGETQQDQSADRTEEMNEEDQVEQEIQEDSEVEEVGGVQEVEETSIKKYDSGSYMVGTDIDPGLYRSEGDIYYWARLSGFSGELDDIKANGNPMSSSAIVEIKDTDIGFETQGSGFWYKIEDDFQGELLTEFGDGIYIVGKDIAAGTYRSDGHVDLIGYWARLKDFSGELDGIIANGNPDGSVIVEINTTDVGFQTFGSGLWTKID